MRIIWRKLKSSGVISNPGHCLICHTIQTYDYMEKRGFENMLRKGANAGNQQFFLCPFIERSRAYICCSVSHVCLSVCKNFYMGHNFRMKRNRAFIFKFKHIYFTSIEKQVLTTYTNLSPFCFLGTAPVLAPNVWANEKIPKLTPAPGNLTRDLKIARPTLYLMTTDTTQLSYLICVFLMFKLCTKLKVICLGQTSRSNEKKQKAIRGKKGFFPSIFCT